MAQAAAANGVPVVAIAGIVEAAERELRTAGFEEAHALTELEPDRAAAWTTRPSW